MRAGLEVALGAMLGLNPDVTTEFLATVDHARYLAANYNPSPEHPLIIGMPIWNAITTRETDLRPAERLDMNHLFPALAALYLLALPENYTWVFPNCRVPLNTQIEAAKRVGRGLVDLRPRHRVTANINDGPRVGCVAHATLLSSSS